MRQARSRPVLRLIRGGLETTPAAGRCTLCGAHIRGSERMLGSPGVPGLAHFSCAHLAFERTPLRLRRAYWAVSKLLPVLLRIPSIRVAFQAALRTAPRPDPFRLLEVLQRAVDGACELPRHRRILARLLINAWRARIPAR